jgi:tetratricopeptide (TPR) repeat protein
LASIAAPAGSDWSQWIRPLLIATSGLAVVVISGLAVFAFVTSGGSKADVATNVDQLQPDVDPPETSSADPSATSEQVSTERAEVDAPTNNTNSRDSSAVEALPVSPAPQASNDAVADDPASQSTSQATQTLAADSAPSLKKQPPPKRPSGQGLSGVSREYDDFHCQQIQQKFGWRVPAAAEFVEVDGERLLITNLEALRRAPAPYLFLPRGEHAIRLRTGEQPLRAEVGEHLATTYAAMRTFFGAGDTIRTKELLARGARTMDVHNTPFLLNLTGASYVAQSDWGAAERKFRRALVVNPLFAPAHLNLAVCRAHANDTEGATREVRLADALNVGNVFGLAAAITQFRREHSLPEHDEVIVPLDVDRYVSPEELTEEDQRLAALMTAMSKYAVEQEDRGKILNNVAVHFADSGKTETALEHFRAALGAIKLAGAQRFTLAEQVFSHMENACRKSGFPEADEYAFMRESVMP